MISQKCKYALRAVMYLSVQSVNSQKTGVKEVSDKLKIPSAYTGKILQELAKHKIISSVKGPGGGFYLTEKNRKTPLLRIVEVVDGLAFFNSCGLGLSQCSESRPCPIHDEFKEVRSRILDLFRTKQIGEISEKILRHELFLVR